MKKTLFFAIFVLIFTVASSQVFQDTQNLTRLTTVKSGNSVLSAYTQKVLPYTKEQHIALSRTNEGKTVFTLMKDDSNESAENVALGSEFEVKDFDIFGSNLYFCGSYNNNGVKEAFLAYVAINDLFYPVNMVPPAPLKIKYTLINNIYQDSIFSIDRIEVFRDFNNIVIAGIGKMYYGEPPYKKFVWDPLGQYEILVDPLEYYLDFFMLYTMKEDSIITNQQEVDTGAFPIYSITNDFEMFYVPTDTIANCYFNKFADITETNNKIYLTSINYSNINIQDSLNNASFIDIISFDKYTRQQQTGRINLPTPVHQAYGVKTTQIYNDQIAIVFNSCFTPLYQNTYVLKVHPCDTICFDVFNISVFDTIERGFYLYDCEYLPNEQELVILKKSIFNENKIDMVFHLDMKKDLIFPYYSHKYVINANRGELFYSDLIHSNTSDYTVLGCSSENKIFVYDTKNTAYEYESHCFTKGEFQVTTINPFSTTSIPILKQCNFSKQILDISDNQHNILYFSTNVYKAIVNLKTVPINRYSTLSIECLK